MELSSRIILFYCYRTVEEDYFVVNNESDPVVEYTSDRVKLDDTAVTLVFGHNISMPYLQGINAFFYGPL